MSRSLKGNGFTINQKITIGTLPSKEFNATCYKVSTGNYLLVFNESVFLLALLLCKVVFLSLLIDVTGNKYTFYLDKAAVSKNIETNVHIQDKFNEIVFSFFVYNNPMMAECYNLKNIMYYVVNDLIDTFEMFIIGHELGHAACGHLENGEFKSHVINNEKMSVFSPRHEMEFEADIFGLDSTMRFMLNKTRPSWMTYPAIELMFQFFSLIGNDDIGNSSSHPTFEDRIVNLRKFSSTQLEDRSFEQCIVMADLFRFSLNEMWCKLMDNYYSYELVYLNKFPTRYDKCRDVSPSFLRRA